MLVQTRAFAGETLKEQTSSLDAGWPDHTWNMGVLWMTHLKRDASNARPGGVRKSQRKVEKTRDVILKKRKLMKKGEQSLNSQGMSYLVN